MQKCNNPKLVIRLLRANMFSFCHLFHRFSVTMEPHCALKHNANDRFGIMK